MMATSDGPPADSPASPDGISDALPADRLTAWFVRHRDQLRRMVAFRLDDRLAARVDPSDVLQEAYLNARQRVGQLDERFAEAPLLWLRQVTEQTLIDLHRRHLGAARRTANKEVSLHAKAWGPETTSYSLAAILCAGDSSPSNAAMREERRNQLHEALEQMDPIDREVLALRHGEELSNAEIAELLGLTPTAASNRYIRALKRLKPLLQE